MPSITVSVGKARITTMTVVKNGVVDATALLEVATGNPGTLRAYVNPSNAREIAVVGVAASPAINAFVACPSLFGATSSAQLFEVIAVPPSPNDGISFGEWGPEVVPPSWAQG